MAFWILEYLSYVIYEATVSSLGNVIISDKLGTKKASTLRSETQKIISSKY
jgi:hypothetical protein